MFTSSFNSFPTHSHFSTLSILCFIKFFKAILLPKYSWMHGLPLHGENNNQSYPAMNSVRSDNDWHRKICHWCNHDMDATGIPNHFQI